MAQYCKYCTYMVCGDANYCSIKDELYSEKHICNTNKCKHFEFNPIDARGTGKEYKPRNPREGEQIKMDGGEE